MEVGINLLEAIMHLLYGCNGGEPRTALMLIRSDFFLYLQREFADFLKHFHPGIFYLYTLFNTLHRTYLSFLLVI